MAHPIVRGAEICITRYLPVAIFGELNMKKKKRKRNVKTIANKLGDKEISKAAQKYGIGHAPVFSNQEATTEENLANTRKRGGR
jgi:hypothetical protein